MTTTIITLLLSWLQCIAYRAFDIPFYFDNYEDMEDVISSTCATGKPETKVSVHIHYGPLLSDELQSEMELNLTNKAEKKKIKFDITVATHLDCSIHISALDI